MTAAERLKILGPAAVNAARRAAKQAPPPSPEVVADLRDIFAPVLAPPTSGRDRRVA